MYEICKVSTESATQGGKGRNLRTILTGAHQVTHSGTIHWHRWVSHLHISKMTLGVGGARISWV